MSYFGFIKEYGGKSRVIYKEKYKRYRIATPKLKIIEVASVSMGIIWKFICTLITNLHDN